MKGKFNSIGLKARRVTLSVVFIIMAITLPNKLVGGDAPTNAVPAE